MRTAAAPPDEPALHPFQEDGARALVARDRLLLADDMGLGKTVQAIRALSILAGRGSMDRALVVAPTAVLDQWRTELRRWSPGLVATVIRGRPEERAWQWRSDSPVFVVGYETLRGDATSAGSVSRSRVWDVVVLDEAQRIKNADTETAKACKRLRYRRAWALTGTPLENRLEDLASILEFVDAAGPQAGPRYGATPALRRRLAAVQLRRRKHDVLPELPPKRVIDVLVELGDEQREAYDRAERAGLVHRRALGEDVTIQHVLELIVRLKQICNTDPRSGASAKLDDIRVRITTLIAQGHRAVVFSQFTDAAYGVARVARELGDFHPLTYTGAMNASERDAVVRRFREELRHGVLVLSLRAGGLGLNLQSASFVFHVDRWWNPALERQAEDRSHRMGQRYPVTVYRYTCAGTIEQRIAEILAQKQQLFDDFVDDVSIDLREPLTARELFAALGLGWRAGRRSSGAAPLGA